MAWDTLRIIEICRRVVMTDCKVAGISKFLEPAVEMNEDKSTLTDKDLS